MSEVKGVFFLGYSGHAYVAIEVAKANGVDIKGYFDKIESSKNPFNLQYIGYEGIVDLKSLVKEDYVFPAVGSNNIRKRLHEFLKAQNINRLVLADPSAYISKTSVIGLSTLINPNAVVNSLVTIGNGCIINSGAIVEHECIIEDYTHIAPGAVLAGNVTVGKNCFIGANAIIKEGIAITDNVVIGAGSVVLKNIAKKGIWIGNPAKLMPQK